MCQVTGTVTLSGGVWGMARRSKNRDRDNSQDFYDDLDQTLAARPAHTPPISHRPVSSVKNLNDLRRWDPAPQVARDTVGRPARIVHKPVATKRLQTRAVGMASPARTNNFLAKPSSFRFADGKLQSICVRREQRRQVLHALQKTKAGKGSPKLRTRWSDVRCNR